MKLFILFLLIAWNGYAQSEISYNEPVLVETHEGEVVYGGFLGGAPHFRAPQGEVLIRQERYSCRVFCSRSSGSFTVPAGNITRPISSLPLRRQNSQWTLRRGRIVMTEDRQIYYVQDVFADGRVVVFPVGSGRNSRNRTNGNFGIHRYANPEIITADEVAAFQVECFLGYCRDQVYQRISGVPLCDRQTLASIADPELRDDVAELGCRLNGALIDATFSDGTMMVGSRLFNPFPSTLQNYYRASDDESYGLYQEGVEL